MKNKTNKIAIKLNNISKSYIKNKKKIEILKDISYEFEYGKIYCIYGKSGVGKTTLIEMIGTIKNVDCGNITIDNICLQEMTEIEQSNLRKNKIGFIFQAFNLIDNLNILENVLLPTCFDNKEKNNQNIIKAKQILKKLGLETRKRHYPKELSGGEQQRVAIARALINEPNIILADEPTAALDSDTTNEIMNILKQLANKGKCIIIVSHESSIRKFADVNLILTKNDLKVGKKYE